MAVETLNVSWDKFPNVAKDMFRQLRNDTAFTDVTLVSEDLVHVRAHRVILAAASDIFQSILSNASPSPGNSQPLLYLKGVRHSQLEALLTFVYNGEVEVEEKNLEELMKAAMELQVKGLFKEGEEGSLHRGKKGGKNSSKTFHKNSGEKGQESNLCGKEGDSKDSLKNLVKRITKERTTKEELGVKTALALKGKKTNSLLPNKTKDPLKSLKREDKVEVRKKQSEKVGENLVDLAIIEDLRKDDSGKYPCPYCDFKNTDLSSLRKHLSTHEVVKFTCMWEGCEQKYSNIDSRKRHEKKSHGEVFVDDFGCDKCESRFTLADNLKKHIIDAHSSKK